MASACGMCRAFVDQLDIVCPSCGDLIYERIDVIDVEVVTPKQLQPVDNSEPGPSKPEQPEPEDPVDKGRRIGAKIAGAIFGGHPAAKLAGSLIGGIIGFEVKGGAKFVELGTDGRKRTFPTAVPSSAEKSKKKRSKKKRKKPSRES